MTRGDVSAILDLSVEVLDRESLLVRVDLNPFMRVAFVIPREGARALANALDAAARRALDKLHGPSQES